MGSHGCRCPQTVDRGETMTIDHGMTSLDDALRSEFVRSLPHEAALVLQESGAAELGTVLRGQSALSSAALLSHLHAAVAAEAIAGLDEVEFLAVTAEVDHDVLARILSHLDQVDRSARVSLLPVDVATDVEAILCYPPTQAGSLMDTAVAAFEPGSHVGKVLETVRAGAFVRTRDVFLIDDERRLLGAIGLESVALASMERTLQDLPWRPVEPVSATDPVADALARFEEGGGRSLPVVNFEGVLLGVIRAGEVVEAAEQVATADMQKMFGAGAEERALSSPIFSVRKRLPWLYINLLTAFGAAAVVGLFESTIAQFTALAVLLPVVAGQSGNSGAQALAVSMRGLSMREIRISHWRAVATKEVVVGFANGIALALVTAIAVLIWSGSPGLAAVIAAAMIFSMTAAGLAGALIPIGLRAVGQDPAQSSSIVLTTVTDIVGFSSFLGLATAFSRFL